MRSAASRPCFSTSLSHRPHSSSGLSPGPSEATSQDLSAGPGSHRSHELTFTPRQRRGASTAPAPAAAPARLPGPRSQPSAPGPAFMEHRSPYISARTAARRASRRSRVRSCGGSTLLRPANSRKSVRIASARHSLENGEVTVRRSSPAFVVLRNERHSLGRVARAKGLRVPLACSTAGRAAAATACAADADAARSASSALVAALRLIDLASAECSGSAAPCLRLSGPPPFSTCFRTDLRASATSALVSATSARDMASPTNPQRAW
mmetsp:Transcript_70677/g.184285  ORF Transcript_70677/g.184285 Transcript_70677/m.184285 type:complete len:266 (-) Transcript_70677:21-818(-)